VKDFLDLDATSLPPPLPWTEVYEEGEKGDYILSVGRLCSTKRTDLIIKAMPGIHEDLKLKIIGLPDEPEYEKYLRSEVEKHHVSHRVEFCGSVSEKELAKYYANCFAVFYGPYDEDYGFVTYEAARSGKPLITTKDSGYVREVVESSGCGVITTPEPDEIASVFTAIFQDEKWYNSLKERGIMLEMPNDWDTVARTLLNAGGLI
jgi:glycosyltransferase involved in cell wall biosynthesis